MVGAGVKLPMGLISPVGNAAFLVGEEGAGRARTAGGGVLPGRYADASGNYPIAGQISSMPA